MKVDLGVPDVVVGVPRCPISFQRDELRLHPAQEGASNSHEVDDVGMTTLHEFVGDQDVIFRAHSGAFSDISQP